MTGSLENNNLFILGKYWSSSSDNAEKQILKSDIKKIFTNVEGSCKSNKQTPCRQNPDFSVPHKFKRSSNVH